MPEPKKKESGLDKAKGVLDPLAKEATEAAKELLGESKQLMKGVLDDLARTHIDPAEAGNLANVLGKMAQFFKEFFDWKAEQDKKDKETAEKAKEEQKGGAQKGGDSFDLESIGKFLKSDAAKEFLSSDTLKQFASSDAVKDLLKSDAVKGLLDSEFVGNALKQYSDVISQNSDLLKQVLPKELSDRLLSFTVPANAASQGLKNPNTIKGNINKSIDYSPDSIRKNPAGYKALYDSSKSIVDKASPEDLKNVQNNPKLKNAMLAMTRVGPVLSQVNPSLTKQIGSDLQTNMEKSPEFRQMAVQSAQSRLSKLGGLQGYNKLPPFQKGFADIDVRTVLMASSLNRGLTNRKDVFNDLNKNFNAFKQDAAKGLSVVTNNNSLNRANQRMQYAQNNPNAPHPTPVNGSPIGKFDDGLKKDMLQSSWVRNQKVNEAQMHLGQVLKKTGARTKEDIDKLPQNVREEIGKDVNTILYGKAADAALASKGKQELNNPAAAEQFKNSKDINGLVDSTKDAFFNKPGADFAALCDNKKADTIGKQMVERNQQMFDKGMEKESPTDKPSMEFNDNMKNDLLRSAAIRGEKTQQAQKYIKDFTKENNLKTKEDFDKLSPEQRKTFDDCVKTVAFAHAADAALGKMDKGEINDPAVRNQLMNSKGLNEATNKTLENFNKDPVEGSKMIRRNDELQKNARREMKPHMDEFKSIAQNDKVPKPETMIVNPDLGVEKKQTPKGPEALSNDVKKDMLKSSAMREEKINEAKEHMQGVIDKNGGPENINMDKLSAADRNSLNLDAQTIAFGNAANSVLGGKGGQLTDPAKQEQLINSAPMNSFVNKTTQQFMANPKVNTETLLNDKEMGEVSQHQVGDKLGQMKDTVEHQQVVNEEPIENFDNNLKTDMLKSKAFRDEKINEAQMHMKSTLEENGVKSNEDFGKLPKTVKDSLDKDAKTIIYGHVADNALSQNGMQKLTDPAMQSKFMNSSKTNFLVDKSLENFQKNPMGNVNTLTNNDVMKQQAAKTNANFQRELHNDTFDRKLQENMIKSQSFRKQAIENATNSIKGIAGEDGKMTAEKYNALSQAAKDSYDASIKTIAFGQMANRALKVNGAKEISDPKAVNQLINSKCLKDFTNNIADQVQKNPGSVSKVLDDVGMRNETNGFIQWGDYKQEVQGIMLDDNLDLKQTLGAALN